MKTRPRRSGFILVSVLAILGLLVLLVVAFLSRAGTERVSSAGYRASLASRQLADTAVNFVEGEINLATTQGTGVAWASQPGMVRTYDATGNPLSVYKLYSAPNLIATTAGIANGKSSDAPPAQWAASPAVWTDLNAPVKLPGGQKVFPILDPGATSAGVAGYAVANAPGATSYQPVPMPVTWLYVLEDGTLVAPTGTGKTVQIAGESASNKIVGRIAFWTDDETCKVNVNTAGAGTFWDVPRAYSVVKASNAPPTWGAPSAFSAAAPVEQALGYYQPGQKEFQRYPGHPAMTDLRAVFPAMTADQVFALSPRLLQGGSTLGTKQVPSGSAVTASFPGYPKRDRLYSGLDELLFSPARGTNAGLTAPQLQQTKFFLTAHSRAPETNLFNLPRVACWPIHADLATNPASAYATAFDRLIALCSSTGTSGNAVPYYFQRKDSTTVSTDIGIARNQSLYAYLQYLTARAEPGYGGDFFAKYGADRDQILTEIFDYVRTVDLCDTNLAAANQYAPTGSVAPTVYGTTQGFGRFTTISKVAIGFICNADASVAASCSTSGATANLALGGVALPAGQRVIQAIVIPEFFSPALGFAGLAPTMQLSGGTLDSLTVNGNIALFPAAANATATYGKAYPDAVFFPGWGTGATRYGGSPSWRSIFLQAKAPTRARSAPQRGSYPVDGTADDPYPFIGTPVRVTPDANGRMVFNGGTVTFTIADSAGNTVQTISATFPTTTVPVPSLVTTGTVASGSTGTTGQDTWWAFQKLGPYGKSVPQGRLTFATQLVGTAAKPYAGAFFRADVATDVVRSVGIPHGDYRLIAATHTVTGSTFQPYANYTDPTKNIASALGNASDLSGEFDYAAIVAGAGKYNSTVTFPNARLADIYPGLALDQTPEATGDYDDALPDFLPGPYINKPDEAAAPVANKPLSVPYYASVSQTSSVSIGVDQQTDNGSFFSPARMIASPVAFGSLPTGVVAGKPWQTLLFRPPAEHPLHPGAVGPADSLLLDLFWMPVVEPWAISDRFSTAGKINMNYQIVPFTYLSRSTGMRALLQSEMVTAVPITEATPTKPAYYKTPYNGTTTALRLPVDMNETLAQLDAVFASGQIYKSASEICGVEIVPQGQTAAKMPAFWQKNALTGDNVRERIYGALYPRLTTKSNTFTVHFQVQSLKKAVTSPAGTWTEGKDSVTGEYRGATTIERYIDATNGAIPDYAAQPTQIPSMKTLDTFYRWRVVSNRQFNP